MFILIATGHKNRIEKISTEFLDCDARQTNTFSESFFTCFIAKILQKLIQEIDEIQKAGTLDENATGSLVKLMRESNVTLHWILLHTTMPTIALEDSKRSRTLRQLVVSESKYTTVNCLRLLLSTAQIEQDVKQMYKDVCLTFLTVVMMRDISGKKCVTVTCLRTVSYCWAKRRSGSEIKELASNV